jgi:sugar phosphate isomerase/epimerase
MKKLLVLFFALFTVTSTAAQAAEYGAIAVSPKSGAYGQSYNYPSKEQAQKRAMAECRKHARDCKIGVTFWNSCGALARGNGGWGASHGSTPREAERKALRICEGYASNCRIRTQVCSR